MKIFICEDNALVAMMLEDLIADLGHEPVGIADTSRRALEGIDLSGAELALVDLDLADGPTGLGLVADLRRRGVPAIIVSGQTATVPLDHGAVALVPKPIDEHAFIAAIDAAAAAGAGSTSGDGAG